MPNNPARQDMANAIRALAMDAVEAANSGHPGMPMGLADAATALFADHLKIFLEIFEAPNKIQRIFTRLIENPMSLRSHRPLIAVIF